MKTGNRIGLATSCGSIGLMLALVVVLFTAVSATQIEVSPASVTANGNDHYDRNPSFVQYGGDSWLFYTKGDFDSTQGVRMSVYNPDNDSYTIWYKRVSATGYPEDLVSAAETRLDLSFTARPVGFDQRDVSVVVFQGNLYVFASAGWGGSPQPIYYYRWDGANWTGPVSLGNAGGGHANVVADADRVYISIEFGASLTLQSLAYTWDGTTLAGPWVIANNNGVPKMTLKDGVLYAVSISPTGNSVNLHTAPAAATLPTWTYVSDPIAIPETGVYVWDPSICHDGTTLYALAAPSASWPDMQWIVQARSTDNGVTWSTPKRVSSGGPGGGSVYWWDFWPIGWSDASGHIYIFYATEGYRGVYGDGAISLASVDWNLDNDHGFYIQQSMDAAIPGDTVLVGDGEYFGNGNRDLRFANKAITVKSKTYPWNARIHCDDISGALHQGFRIYSGETLNSVLDGLSIEGANYEAAVSCSSSSPTIKNCYFRANTVNGVFVTNSSNPSILGCKFLENTGNGIRIRATNPQRPSVLIRNCLVRGSGSDGIYIEDGGAVIDSTDIISNSGDGVHDESFTTTLKASHLMCRGNTGYGIYVDFWGGLFNIRNCTIVDNGQGIGYRFNMPKGSVEPGTLPLPDSGYLSNNIAAYNHGRGIVKLWVDAYSLVGSCNDAFGNAGGDYVGTPFGAGDNLGNISLNPLFCDTATSDYRLYDNSPCLPTNNSCQKQIGKYGLGCTHNYLCGDANGDGAVDISDAVFLISFIFSGGVAPEPWQAADANCDGTVDISDVVYLISFIFGGGPAPCADCPISPSGQFVGMGECKLHKSMAEGDSARCIQWQYNNDGTLLLKHVNAVFNCCPTIETQVSVVGSMIMIQEVETDGPCDCMCLYDLDYQIINLPVGQYTIIVTEPYVSPPLQFAADLATTPSGEYCEGD